MRQLAMYSYLVRGAEDKEVIESRLLFLEEDPKNKNVLYRTRVSEEQIDLLVRDITDYEKLLTTGEWTKRLCQVKSYNGGMCEYCERINKILEK
jgi:hypothetical protein